MFSLRSAQGRAILAGAVLVVLLASVATLAVWRTRDIQQQHDEFEQAAAAAAALESAKGQFYLELSLLSAFVFSADPILLDEYHQTMVAVHESLNQARSEALARGEEDGFLALGTLTQQIVEFNNSLNTTIPTLLGADAATRAQLAVVALPEIQAAAGAITSDLDELIEKEQEELTARRAAANSAANTTLWLLAGFGAAAFLVAVSTIAMLIVSVIRPLAALRASARAITSGDPEARAKVHGPEEVTSLARDLNEMTDALSAKTKEYIDTTNLTGDIIVRVGKDGRWTFLNDAACQFFGRPREELLGVQFADYLHPEDIEPTAQAVQDMIESKEPVKGFVNRQVTPLGTRVMEWNAIPLFDEEGHYTGFQTTGRDITERKQMEEELRESESKHRTLLENLPQKIFSKDKNSVYTSCNENYAQDLNIKPDEIVGKTDYDFYPKELAEKYRADDKRIMQSGKTEDLEEAYVQDGKEVFVQTVKTPIKDENGNVVGILGVFWDITARKQMEDALRDSEERYRDLFESATDLVQSAAPDGSLVYVNRAWREALGYEESEIAGLSLFDIIHPDSKAHCMKMFERVMAGEKLDHVEAIFVAKDGRSISVEGNVNWRFEDGKPVATRGIFRDITARKQMEQERDRLHAELEVRAITDGLTDLYNHAHFYQRLAEEIDRSKRYGRGFAVLMMDVDKFKQLNDSRGHQAGDDALCLVADCIRTGLRRSDIAFRYGGDEFAAILLNADSSRAQAIAKRVKRCLARRLEEANDPTAAWLGLSAGIACFPDDATTADDLVKIADAALYDAKRVAHACSSIEQAQAAAPLATAKAAGRSKG